MTLVVIVAIVAKLDVLRVAKLLMLYTTQVVAKGCKVVNVIHHTGGCKGLQSCQCYTPHRWYETYNERVSFFFLIQDLNVER